MAAAAAPPLPLAPSVLHAPLCLLLVSALRRPTGPLTPQGAQLTALLLAAVNANFIPVLRPRALQPGLSQVYRYQSWGGQDALPVFQRGQTFQPAAIELKQVGEGVPSLVARCCRPGM